MKCNVNLITHQKSTPACVPVSSCQWALLFFDAAVGSAVCSCYMMLLRIPAVATASISELIELFPWLLVTTDKLQPRTCTSRLVGCNDRRAAVHVPSNKDTSGTSPNHITHEDTTTSSNFVPGRYKEAILLCSTH